MRTPFEEQSLPGLPDLEDKDQGTLEFRTMFIEQKRYKVFALATNRSGSPEEIIHWHRARCGKGEEIHSVLKSDLAGGKLPSGAFGANAAWWLVTVLSHNLNATLKRSVLGPMDSGWLRRRLKAIRYHLIHVAGRLVHHGRRLYLRLCHGDPGGAVLLEARRRIAALV